MDVLREVFYRDGSLRDIYVCGTTVDDWQKLLTFLRAEKYRFTYEIGGVETSMPDDFSQIQNHIGSTGQLLSIYVDKVRLNCHFFCVEEIELDLLPNDVDTKDRVEAVFEFMSEVGRTLSKDVILTPENGRDQVLLRYNLKMNELEHGTG